jgi:DNA-binding HxlR family transcriptional regulator
VPHDVVGEQGRGGGEVAGLEGVEVAARIADKWTAMVVSVLGDGRARFGDLKVRLGGISGKVLTETLTRRENYDAGRG